MATSNAARRSEPNTLEEMHARKKEADRRQAEAAARLRVAVRDEPAPRPATQPPVPASEPEAELVTPPEPPTIDPAVDAQIRATLGEDTIERTPRRIIGRVAAEYGVSYEEIVGEGRDANTLAARDAAWIAVHAVHAKRSLPWFGRQFGNRDHTTVLHAFRRLGLVAAAAPNPALAALTVDADGVRTVEPLALPDLTPGLVEGTAPTFRMVDPRALRIDQAYQRGLSERSLLLIRRIVSEWSWRAFKPPIVVEGDGALHVIDGQHTAIAAATHGGIAQIPVMLVEAAARTERAEAFVRHNRDRLHITGVQMHVSQVAAGDPIAVGVEEACRRAGARILRSNTSVMRYRPGDTIAIEALTRLVRRHGVDLAARIIGVCVAGEQAPVRAENLRAVESLLTASEHGGVYEPDDLASAFRKLGAELPRKVAMFAATHRVARWQAVMAVLAQTAKRRRGGGEAA